MTQREFSVSDVHLALDGELAADDRAEFERWLDAHPEMKALSARFERDRAALAAALAPVLQEPVPTRLMDLASGKVRPRRLWPRLRNAAAAAVIFVAGGVAGYLAASAGLLTGGTAEDEFAETAIDAYVVYAASQPHAVEVGADRPYLEGWLSKRVGLNLVVPDLSAEGFELLGGRILPAGHHAAALLVYQDKAGNQLSIYVTGEGTAKTKGTYTAGEDGPTAIYWLDKGYGCAIVGSMPQEQLAGVARTAWRQMVDAVRS
jgi:anti-sigma factor RsiW